MNFLLKNLELELSENHLLPGERLLETGRVAGLSESERHLWVARVDGFWLGARAVANAAAFA